MPPKDPSATSGKQIPNQQQPPTDQIQQDSPNNQSAVNQSGLQQSGVDNDQSQNNQLDGKPKDDGDQVDQSKVQKSIDAEPLAKSQVVEEKKTFITQQKKEDEIVWKAYDFLFPAGKLAKLVKVFDATVKNFPYTDILNKLKLVSGYPVVNLIGAKDVGRGKFLAGIARACFNTDAIIVDSAIATGIEKYTMRRGVQLIGIAPENEVKFPKINPTSIDPFEISNGHTHIFLINNKEKDLTWTNESLFKILLINKIAEGKQSLKKGKDSCKIVHVLLADTPYYADEVRLAIKYNQPIIVVKGSKVCNEIIANFKPQESGGEDSQKQGNQQSGHHQISENYQLLDEELRSLLPKAHIFILDSDNSEDVAQYIHFLLTVNPWFEPPKEKPKKD